MSLGQEIAQEKPFASAAEEALLNLLRTADALQREMHLLIKPWGITSTQYNVLRILRGAQPQGLTCTAIGLRMITADPDITRLMGRMKTMKLVRQQRDKQDRRVVWNHISPEGLKLLDKMHSAIEGGPEELLSNLTEHDREELIRLLELVRSSRGIGRATCDGSHAVQSSPQAHS